MDPSPDVIDAWTADEGKVSVVLAWAGMTPEFAEDLLSWLDIRPTEHFRNFALITLDDLAGFELTVGNRNSINVAVHGCRVAAGMEKTFEQRRDMELKTLELETKKALAAPSGPAPSTPLLVPPLQSPNIVKLAEVLDQGQPGEVPFLPKPTIDEMYAEYTRVFGDPPKPEEALTRDQLTALDTAVKILDSVFVDLAVWTVYGARSLRKQRVGGQVLDIRGQLVPCELVGPNCCEQWEPGYKILSTGCVMQKLMYAARLEAYGKRIRD